MRNFKEFVDLVEAVAPTSTAKEDISFQASPSGYKAEFSWKGSDYQVDMQLMPGGVHIYRNKYTEIPGTYSILFKGPEDYSLTHTSGTDSLHIYRKLLTSVKELFDSTEVNAIIFHPFDEKMWVPYELFYKQFLLPDPPAGVGFLRINPETYVRKDYVRDNREAFPPDIWRQAVRTARSVRQEIENVKQRENHFRAVRRKVAPFIKKFIHLDADIPGVKAGTYVPYVSDSYEEPLGLIYKSMGPLRRMEVEVDDIDKTLAAMRPASPQEAEAFMSGARLGMYDHWMKDHLPQAMVQRLSNASQTQS